PPIRTTPTLALLAPLPIYHHPPLLLRHEVDAHVVTLSELHPKLILVEPSIFLAIRAAHEKSAWRNPDEFHAEIVRNFLFRDNLRSAQHTSELQSHLNIVCR